jgi:hypothetical protein
VDVPAGTEKVAEVAEGEHTSLESIDSILGLTPEPPKVGGNEAEPTSQNGAKPTVNAAAGTEIVSGIVRNEEGNLVVAARFTVPGEGTAEKPYIITWNLLLAVQEHYRPRQGMTEVPAWITFFKGKHVRLTGFVMPPMMGDDMREVLLMQNEWDGCCVGVPPTPYDAIEVKLKRNPNGLSQYTMNFGEVTGVFNVDPFVQGEWLLGLYLMDGAELVVKGL